MSRQIALDSISLRPTPRWGHTEYSLEYHDEYMRKVTGLAPSDPDFRREFYDRSDFDFLWSVNDGLHGDWASRGRATDMGHAEYAADGSDYRKPNESPFKSPQEVWGFDAVAEYGLPEFDEQVRAYEEWWTTSQARTPNQLLTGGYYKTIVSGAIQAFGWDMFLEAAARPEKIEKVLDSIFQMTLFHMRAWAETSVEVIIQHDDFVWTAGPFMRPSFYRSVIIPRYAELWKPLRAAGKKIVFCSDGTFTEFAEDIVAAGADALCFEPSNSFEFMVERFGSSHALIGSAVDCRDMSFSPWEQVSSSIDRTLELAERCKGLILAVGNHLPPNVSDDMLERYMARYRERWSRSITK